jgi:hypothetical protein
MSLAQKNITLRLPAEPWVEDLEAYLDQAMAGSLAPSRNQVLVSLMALGLQRTHSLLQKAKR